MIMANLTLYVFLLLLSSHLSATILFSKAYNKVLFHHSCKCVQFVLIYAFFQKLNVCSNTGMGMLLLRFYRSIQNIGYGKSLVFCIDYLDNEYLFPASISEYLFYILSNTLICIIFFSRSTIVEFIIFITFYRVAQK